MNNLSIVVQIIIANKLESLDGIKHYIIDIIVYGHIFITSYKTWKDMIEVILNISHGILGDDTLTVVALYIKEL